MKKVYPFIVAAVLVLGAYYLWTTFGGSGLTTHISSFHSSKGSTSSAAAKQPEWRSVDQSDAGFQLKMPTEPRHVVVQASNELGGTEPVNMLITSTESETTYAVAWADKPPVARVNGLSPDKTLDQARDGATSKTQTSMVSETRVNPQGYPGREFIARNVGGGYLETRFVMAGTRLYMLIATSPSASVRHEEEIARFFNSFTLANDQKVPETLPAATR
jgi:hypothetical protein